jgi:ABC-type nitrate/sulfonate/bicarbonate transport system permease component
MSLTAVRQWCVRWSVRLVSRCWGGAVLLMGWQLWVLYATPNELIVVPPAAVLRDIAAWPAIYLHCAAWTMAAAVAGLAAGMLAGLLLAIAAWTSALFEGMLAPAAVLVSATPVVCLIPLLARLLGYGAATEFATVTLMIFFPSFVFANSGLRALPPMSGELLSTWNTPVRRRLVLLALPSAMPSLAIALRTGAATSVLVAVIGEYLMQTGGLGGLIAVTMQQFDMPRALGASLIAMLASAVFYALAGLVERHTRARYGSLGP